MSHSGLWKARPWPLDLRLLDSSGRAQLPALQLPLTRRPLQGQGPLGGHMGTEGSRDGRVGEGVLGRAEAPLIWTPLPSSGREQGPGPVQGTDLFCKICSPGGHRAGDVQATPHWTVRCTAAPPFPPAVSALQASQPPDTLRPKSLTSYHGTCSLRCGNLARTASPSPK